MASLDNHNQNPLVFVWSAPVERILTKIAKCKEVLDSLHEEPYLVAEGIIASYHSRGGG
jgi:hypothetical protein